MHRDAETMSTLGANYGASVAVPTSVQRFVQSVRTAGAAALVDFVGPAGPTPTSGDVALLTHMKSWSRSPEIYAAVVREGDDLVRTGSSPAASPRFDHAARDLQADLPADLQADLLADLAGDLDLMWRIDCFPKPWVSLLDVPLAPSAIALSTFGTHRVAGAGYRFAIPPIGQYGLPLAGVARALARLPRQLGMYLALTGHALDDAGAYAAGLVTHSIPASDYPAIIAALSDGQPVDPLLDDLHRPTASPDAAGERAAMVELIERCFAPPTVADILGTLESVGGAQRSWALAAAAAIRQRAPLRSAAGHRLVSRAAGLDVRKSLILTHRVARNWQLCDPGDLGHLERLFQEPSAGDLGLPTRAEIASGRA